MVKEESLHSILAGNRRWAAPGALMREGDRAAQVPGSTQPRQRARASLLAQPKVLSVTRGHSYFAGKCTLSGAHFIGSLCGDKEPVGGGENSTLREETPSC